MSKFNMYLPYQHHAMKNRHKLKTGSLCQVARLVTKLREVPILNPDRDTDFLRQDLVVLLSPCM